MINGEHMNQHLSPSAREDQPLTSPETSQRWLVRSLLRTEAPSFLSRRAGDRLITLAAGLPEGSLICLRMASTGRGPVIVEIAARTDQPDMGELIAWVYEDVAILQPMEGAALDYTSDGLHAGAAPNRVTELLPAVRAQQASAWSDLMEPPSHQRGAAPSLHGTETHLWPVPAVSDGMELLKALASTAAEIRVHLAPCHDMELDMITQSTLRAVQGADPAVHASYVGTPVEARLLVGHDGALSPRLRGALLRRGLGLTLVARDAGIDEVLEAWAGSARALCGWGQPFGVAQCLTPVPCCGPEPIICGVPTTMPVTRPVSLDADVCRTGLRVGTAVAADGTAREVRISPEDLQLHMQVLGATGSGKSTLLSALAHETIAAGGGVSVIDPHGGLVDRIVGEVDPSEAGRLAVVRSGDAEHPTPLNPLAGRDPELITDVMISVLRELHDPRNQGFMGPVWERSFASLMAAQRVLFGRRANMALIPTLAASQQRLKRVAEAIAGEEPEVAATLETTFVKRRPEDFAEMVTWVNSKFQRLVGSAELRGILASGEDLVDVVDVVEQRKALLVDLASPSIGDLGAQLLGEMWLAKHWEAMSQRRDRSVPHLLIIDEAHLFASGLLSRLLTQARKFGVAVVLAHQNLEQLTPSLREAVLSSTGSVVAFRTGARESAATLDRLGSWTGGLLTRLPRLSAAVTLSDGMLQSDAFTLTVDHNRRVTGRTDATAVAAMEAASRSRYATTLEQTPPLTQADIEREISLRRERGSGSSFLDEWLARRNADSAAPQTASSPTEATA